MRVGIETFVNVANYGGGACITSTGQLMFEDCEFSQNEARAQEAAGDQRGALATYQVVVSEFPGSYSAVEAQGKVNELSARLGDVLSYLRLFALGLSGAKLSATFNDLAASAWDSAGFGVIAAIGIVFLGHTLNLILSIMSGVVHGLRLNCIEFFKWSLPDEGYLFKAFAKKARQP